MDKRLIVGCRVRLGRKTRAERIVGDTVVIGNDAIVDYVEGRIIIVKRKASIDEVKYVEKLEAHPNTDIGKSEKTTALSDEVPCKPM